MKRILFFALLLGLSLGTQSCLVLVKEDQGKHKGWGKHNFSKGRGPSINIENNDYRGGDQKEHRGGKGKKRR